MMLSEIILGTLLLAQTYNVPFSPRAAAPTQVNCGTDTGDRDVGSWINAAYAATYCTTGSNSGGYTVDSCSMQWAGGWAGTAHWRCAIYDDDGGSPSSPDNLLCESASTTVVAPSAQTTYSADLSGASCGTLSASTKYWIGIQYDSWNDQNLYGGSASGQQGEQQSQSYGAFPAPWGSGSTYDQNPLLFVTLNEE